MGILCLKGGAEGETAAEMSQQVKILATDDSSSISETHVVEGEAISISCY